MDIHFGFLMCRTRILTILKDYIVYMTYDRHGQWDYGSSYAE